MNKVDDVQSLVSKFYFPANKFNARMSSKGKALRNKAHEDMTKHDVMVWEKGANTPPLSFH